MAVGSVVARPGKSNPAVCKGPEEFDVLFDTILLTAILLLLSHVLHLFLKRFHQPSIISQMLAGIALGPISGLLLRHQNSADYLSSTATLGRNLFMFLVGLEVDIAYLFRTSREAAALAGGGVLVSAILAGAFSPVVYWLTKAQGNRFYFAFVLMLVFANTASPVLVRMTAELKLTASNVGRLAITAALINDMTCLVLVALTSLATQENNTTNPEKQLMAGLFALTVMVVAAYLMRPIVSWLNLRNKQRRHIKNVEVIALLLLVIIASSMTEIFGYSSMMASYLLGIAFPREGKTARSLVHKLMYPVHNLILPIYFGYMAMRTDLSVLRHGRLVGTVVIVVTFGSVGKVAGTLLAARYLELTVHDGLIIGFLLNVKGHIDLIIIGMSRRNQIWGPDSFMVMLLTVVLNTLAAGPAVAALVRREREALRFRAMGMEYQKVDNELRLVACVHTIRDVPAVLHLIEFSSGNKKYPLSACLMHLIEFTQNTTAAMLYHQHEDRDDDDDEDVYGTDDARQINTVVDGFIGRTGINARLVTAISTFTSMHEDICNGAEDNHASILIVPFHKSQRVGGKMVSEKDGVREVNLKVHQYAPCTVGVLVDRGPSRTTQESTGQILYRVVALFFGGPDDREAVAYGLRLMLHQSVGLTVIRFLPASRRAYEAEIEIQASKDEEVLMAISNHERENNADETFLSSFYSSFVASGSASYEERYVENSAETVMAISEVAGMYSLFIVGRGRRGLSPLTMGINGWEKSPELGEIGDLLASADFKISGSILVMQQHSDSDEFAV